MTNIKYVVKVNHSGTHGPAYVQRIDRSPIQMTTNRKAGTDDGKIYGRRRR